MHDFLPVMAALAMTPAPAVAQAGAGYSHPGVELVVAVATAAAVCLCVLLHYEVLNALSRRLAGLGGRRRRRVLFGIFGVLSVHVAEIWVFGVAYALLLLWPACGGIHGIAEPDFLDHVYFSAMTFTTVGFGDVYPRGPIRFLAGTEALTGLVLITWSASFTFLEMSRFWHDR